MSEPRVEVHDGADVLATAVAGELLSRLADAQAAGGVPQIGLTGGSIAAAVHREVARLSAGSGVDWSQVVVWWGDERFVDPADPERNDRQAREQWLDKLGLDPTKVHPMPAAEGGADAESAAAAYAEELRQHGSGEFDVLMLGVGEDGHVASLFPGYPQVDVLDADAVAVIDSPKPPPTRISLTLAALNRARAVWFLVSGDGKAGAVARAMAEDADPRDVPACAVRGSVETLWFLDRAAASRL